MTYLQSIRRVAISESLYYRACELAELDSTIGALLDKFHAAKAAHRAAFGTLRKSEGQWA